MLVSVDCLWPSVWDLPGLLETRQYFLLKSGCSDSVGQLRALLNEQFFHFGWQVLTLYWPRGWACWIGLPGGVGLAVWLLLIPVGGAFCPSRAGESYSCESAGRPASSPPSPGAMANSPIWTLSLHSIFSGLWLLVLRQTWYHNPPDPASQVVWL